MAKYLWPKYYTENYAMDIEGISRAVAEAMEMDSHYIIF